MGVKNVVNKPSSSVIDHCQHIFIPQTDFFLWLSGGPAEAVSGAAKPSHQSALPGRYQPDCTDGLCAALPVAAGKKQVLGVRLRGEVMIKNSE